MITIVNVVVLTINTSLSPSTEFSEEGGNTSSPAGKKYKEQFINLQR